MILYFINLCILCTFPTSTLQEAPSCTIRQNPGEDVTYVCCARKYLDNGTCKECPIGTTSERGSNNISDCTICPKPRYGKHCLQECKCNASERCDNVHGCIIPITTEAGTTITSKTTANCSYGYQTEWIVVVLFLAIIMAIHLSKCIFNIIREKIGS